MADLQFNNFGEYWSPAPTILFVARNNLSVHHVSSNSSNHFFVADAFKDAADEPGASQGEKVHVRVQQRNGRKCISTIQGLADDLDIKRILKEFKKTFSCNGAIVKYDELGEIIQLSGDQRANVKSFLVDQEICTESQIQLHGF